MNRRGRMIFFYGAYAGHFLTLLKFGAWQYPERGFDR